MRLQKPVVLLELKGPGKEFSFDDAFELLGDLETNLRTLDSAAVVELRTHTSKPLSELQETVRGRRWKRAESEVCRA
jgi:hypothetical protein